jgi:hypothetical protein
MNPVHRYALPLILAVSCNFDEDRSLGHLEPRDSSDAGGMATSRGGGTASSIPQGGATTAHLGGARGDIVTPCTATDTSACLDGQYCAFDTDCGHVATGTCRDRPLGCDPPTLRQLVCGCDRKYHASVCEAERSGVSIAPLSSCTPVACDDVLDCAQFEESCTLYFGAKFPAVACSANGNCVCESAIIM